MPTTTRFPFRNGHRFTSPCDIRTLVMRLTANPRFPCALVDADTSQIVKVSGYPSILSDYLVRNGYTRTNV